MGMSHFPLDSSSILFAPRSQGLFSGLYAQVHLSQLEHSFISSTSTFSFKKRSLLTCLPRLSLQLLEQPCMCIASQASQGRRQTVLLPITLDSFFSSSALVLGPWVPALDEKCRSLPLCPPTDIVGGLLRGFRWGALPSGQRSSPLLQEGN